MKNNKSLTNKCFKKVEQFYKNGENLRSTALKNYTSGDGDNKGFEALVDELLWTIVDDLKIDRSRVDIHGRYFQNDYSVKPAKDTKCPQRMDHHIMIDGKHPLIIESRAWIDKPFYTLKRGVTRNFMELPYVRKQLTEDVQFIYVGLAIDVMDRCPQTLDISMGHGDRVNTFKFSPKRRNDKKWNYFDNGVHKEGVIGFVTFVRDHLSKYAKGE